jgi:D-alanyl-D-alanine carboxypeptidase
LTKIATVLAAYTIDLDIDREVRVSAKAVRRQGTSAGLIEGKFFGISKGELITLRNLAYAIMLPSGNDAAQALVE